MNKTIQTPELSMNVTNTCDTCLDKGTKANHRKHILELEPSLGSDIINKDFKQCIDN